MFWFSAAMTPAFLKKQLKYPAPDFASATPAEVSLLHWVAVVVLHATPAVASHLQLVARLMMRLVRQIVMVWSSQALMLQVQVEPAANLQHHYSEFDEHSE